MRLKFNNKRVEEAFLKLINELKRYNIVEIIDEEPESKELPAFDENIFADVMLTTEILRYRGDLYIVEFSIDRKDHPVIDGLFNKVIKIAKRLLAGDDVDLAKFSRDLADNIRRWVVLLQAKKPVEKRKRLVWYQVPIQSRLVRARLTSNKSYLYLKIITNGTSLQNVRTLKRLYIYPDYTGAMLFNL